MDGPILHRIVLLLQLLWLFSRKNNCAIVPNSIQLDDYHTRVKKFLKYVAFLRICIIHRKLKKFDGTWELNSFDWTSIFVKSRKYYKGEHIWSYNPPACLQHLNFGLSWPGWIGAKCKDKTLLAIEIFFIFPTLHCHSQVLLLSIQRKTWSSSQQPITKQQKIFFPPTIWIWRVKRSNLLSLIIFSRFYHIKNEFNTLWILCWRP